VITNCTGIVLAGGASRRMGRDKAQIEVCGETMLERACRTLAEVFEDVVCIGRADDGGRLPFTCVPDARPGMGPLAGLETALAATSTAWVFVAACDMPMLTAAAIEAIWRRGDGGASRAIVPQVAGRLHPLAGFYARDALSRATAALDEGRPSATRFANEIGARVVDVDDDGEIVRALTNVNDPGGLERAAAEMRAGGTRE